MKKRSVKDLNWNLSIKQEKRVTTLKGLKRQWQENCKRLKIQSDAYTKIFEDEERAVD